MGTSEESMNSDVSNDRPRASPVFTVRECRPVIVRSQADRGSLCFLHGRNTEVVVVSHEKAAEV